MYMYILYACIYVYIYVTSFTFLTQGVIVHSVCRQTFQMLPGSSLSPAVLPSASVPPAMKETENVPDRA